MLKRRSERLSNDSRSNPIGRRLSVNQILVEATDSTWENVGCVSKVEWPLTRALGISHWQCVIISDL